MAQADYGVSVFVNCPFDGPFDGSFHGPFRPLLDAMVFAILDCGFQPRCAREINDSGYVRIDKLVKLIRESRFAIHDLSRTELDPINALPRFNMPMELGLFLGAKSFGFAEQTAKVCMITDSEAYRYQKYLSDIAGQDPVAHDNSPKGMIAAVRDFLDDYSRNSPLHGGEKMHGRFQKFHEQDLPVMIERAHIERSELTDNNYVKFTATWIEQNDLLAEK